MNTKMILSLAVLGLLAVGAYYIVAWQEKALERADPTAIVAENFGGDFTLTNHLGEKVTQDDFRDQWRLIYFGFTYCPAICPTELQKIASALSLLGDTGDRVTPIFISVDPERDTVNVMKQYISLFHPRLIGLTGTVQQVDQAKNGYKVYSAKVQDETMSDYTVDHSSFIYFMGPGDTLYRIFKMDDTAKEMAAYIAATIKN